MPGGGLRLRDGTPVVLDESLLEAQPVPAADLTFLRAPDDPRLRPDIPMDWDGSGYVLIYKRLEHGRFHFFDRAQGRDGAYELRASELALVLEGIDLRGARRRLSHDEIMNLRARA